MPRPFLPTPSSFTTSLSMPLADNAPTRPPSPKSHKHTPPDHMATTLPSLPFFFLSLIPPLWLIPLSLPSLPQCSIARHSPSGRSTLSGVRTAFSTGTTRLLRYPSSSRRLASCAPKLTRVMSLHGRVRRSDILIGSSVGKAVGH